MNRMKKYMWLLVLIELLVLVMMGVMLVVRWRSSQNIDVSVTDWESDYVAYDSINGWSIDEKNFRSEGGIDFIHGPYIMLEKGTYRIMMEYHCDYDQSCSAYSEDDSFGLKAGGAWLGRNYDSITYDFEAKEDIRDFQFLVKYNGKGYLQVNSIAITPSPFGSIRNICIVLFLFVCLDICIMLFDKIKKNKNNILALLGITLLTSLPLFTDGIWGGDDLGFHLMRIEGIAREIRMGNIPVRMSSAWLDGYGYPVSVYYGDLLLYIPAVMNLLGFSATAAYKCYVFMINMGTAVLTYYCMNCMCRDKKIALLTSLAYCTASYRMINIYARAAVGEYSAMMFLPLVAVAVYKMYTDDVSDYREYRKNALLLAIGMSGLIGTHILSTEMAVFVLILICVSLLKLTFRKETIKVYLLAVAETCALSAYFIVPFLDYTLNVSTRIEAFVDRGGARIQERGLAISEYFSFFRQMYQENLAYANTRRLYSPGMILMVTLIVAIVFCINSNKDKKIKIMVIYACLVTAVTLNIFPWDYIGAHYLIGNILSQVQFPWRYISILTMILTLLLGSLLAQISTDRARLSQAKWAIVIAGFVMTCFFTTDYMNGDIFVAPYSGAELDRYSVGTGEYLRDGTSREIFETFSSDTVSERMQEVSIVSRRGSSMTVRCVAADEEGWIWLPLFHYKGYHVTDDDGNEYTIRDSVHNQIEVSVPIGFDGYLYVEYKEPWYWRLAELISLVTVLGLCVSKGVFRR